MKNKAPREARRLQPSDAVPFTFGRNYIKRLTELREGIGEDRFNEEVSGLYTKAAFVGLTLYNSAIMAAPAIYEGIKSGIETFVN